MTRRGYAGVLLAAGALLTGCTVDRTQLLIGVDTDLSWGSGGLIQSVTLEMRRGDQDGALRSRRTTALGEASGRQALPLWVTVVPTDESDGSPLWVEALGCGTPDGCTRETAVVAQRASVRFVTGETGVLRLLLADACRSRRCALNERCAAATGECIGVDAQDEARAYGGVLPGRWADASVRADAISVVDAPTAEAGRDVSAVDVGGDAGFDVPTVDIGSDVPTVDVGGDVRCPAPQSVCGSACVNTNSDPLNCGTCGRVCSGGLLCGAGVCYCPGSGCAGSDAGVDGGVPDVGSGSDAGGPPTCSSGTHRCGESCVSDTAVTSCGSSCSPCLVPTGGSATCSAGACGQSCPGGTTLCGGACITLTTTANCGACGRACTTGQTCSGGTCVSSGDAGTGTCPAGMQYIPAGSFLMGDADTASARAQPPHMVTLSAFCMDLTEVTVADYRGCAAPECTTPSTGGSCNWGVTGRDNHPINCVDWNQSRAYCQSRGGDLPTEAQWEYAARGSDVANHIYPWGNAAPASQLCWSGVTGQLSTCPVQSYPSGNSPFGLFDMAGNVWEWTRDFYASYASAAAIDPTGPTSGTNRVYRGGSWDRTTAANVRAASRDGLTPTNRYDNFGFRCARGAI